MIRLLHELRSLPNAWSPHDPPTSLADQYQEFAERSSVLTDDALQLLIDTNKELTSGWKQRLTSLLPAVDPEQIMAQLRTDGATWFVPDFGMAENRDDESDQIAVSDDIDVVPDASEKRDRVRDLDESADIDSEDIDDDAEEDESDD